jgi:hypothetical protein
MLLSFVFTFFLKGLPRLLLLVGFDFLFVLYACSWEFHLRFRILFSISVGIEGLCSGTSKSWVSSPLLSRLLSSSLCVYGSIEPFQCITRCRCDSSKRHPHERCHWDCSTQNRLLGSVGCLITFALSLTAPQKPQSRLDSFVMASSSTRSDWETLRTGRPCRCNNASTSASWVSYSRTWSMVFISW